MGTPDGAPRPGPPAAPAPAAEPAPSAQQPPGALSPPSPMTMLRSPGYLRLLAQAAIIGVPISAAAFGFLALISYLQKEIFTHLPHGLGFAAEPVWWPLPVLAAGGVLAALAIRYLPGNGGVSPAGGFAVHAAPTPVQLPGIICAALAASSSTPSSAPTRRSSPSAAAWLSWPSACPGGGKCPRPG